MTLDQKMDAYVTDSEAWKEPHNEVMDKYARAEKLGEFIHSGLDVLRRLQTRKATTFEEAVSISDSYLQWLRVGHSILPSVEQLIEDDFEVEGSKQFRKSLNRETMLVRQLVETRESAQRAIDGDGAELSDFLATI